MKPGFFGAGIRRLQTSFLIAGLLACLSAWFLILGRPGWDKSAVLILLPVLIVFWWIVIRTVRKNNQHFLLKDDRQGFMSGLRLDEKTAVMDGSNIYHFGHAHGLDAQPLGEVAYMLRSQGYRIVCFFDANIFYTLAEHGAFGSDKRHSVAILESIFGLTEDEIYVVSSGIQADKYILECLKYMPISFAVTNDRFRDYERQYPTVMVDNRWRKGVKVSGGEIKLR